MKKFKLNLVLFFAVAALVLPVSGAESAPVAANATAIPQSSALPALKDAYKGIFFIGVAVSQNQFSGRNAADAALITQQFNSISPENVLKWESIQPRPGPDGYNFRPADQYVDFGEKNGMFIIGHNLVWHSQTPAWVFQNDDGSPISRDALLARMKEHITTVVGRYKGKIKGWDVVNEAIDDKGGLRRSQWYEIIGPEYLVKAYQYAHEADPDAELYYNDYSLETPVKRATAVELVKYLQAQGIHLTGIGLQSHYKLDPKIPTLQSIDDTIKTFSDLGLKVMITELDVDVLPGKAGADINQMQTGTGEDPYTTGLPDDVQQALAKRYTDVFAIYLKHRADISRVTFWGLNDSQTWLNGFPFRGRTNHPLLFDRQDKPKPAFYAVLNAPQVATKSPAAKP